MSKSAILPAKVSESFKLAKGAPNAFYDRKHGDIDFATISLEKAEELVTANCLHIDRIKKVLPTQS